MSQRRRAYLLQTLSDLVVYYFLYTPRYYGLYDVWGENVSIKLEYDGMQMMQLLEGSSVHVSVFHHYSFVKLVVSYHI